MDFLKVSLTKEEVYDFGTNLAEDVEEPLNNQLVLNSDTSDTSDSECERVYNDTGLLGSTRSGGPQADRPTQSQAAATKYVCRGQGEDHTPSPSTAPINFSAPEDRCDGDWTLKLCEGCENSRWCPFHGKDGSEYCRFGKCEAVKHGREHIRKDTALLKRTCAEEEDKPGLWVCEGCPCPYNGALCGCNERN